MGPAGAHFGYFARTPGGFPETGAGWRAARRGRQEHIPGPASVGAGASSRSPTAAIPRSQDPEDRRGLQNRKGAAVARRTRWRRPTAATHQRPGLDLDTSKESALRRPPWTQPFGLVRRIARRRHRERPDFPRAFQGKSRHVHPRRVPRSGRHQPWRGRPSLRPPLPKPIPKVDPYPSGPDADVTLDVRKATLLPAETPLFVGNLFLPASLQEETDIST